ncbi:MAG TPA: glutamine-hydrolyzing carbamoyl-phosphate synthase small subunit [Thermoanaerobaculia bacterium]|nr:glutamine-hydrolyzing carbamoyl-phosphate synthase small subunit [Thermoanaerobaculia bacterium]
MLPAPPHDALLVLADGSVFPARAVAPGTRFGEVVFHTAMSGYQEILTDPATAGQIVVMTQPHLGNYGVSASWAESDRPRAAGVVARQFTPEPANRAAEGGLRGYLRAHRVPAVEGLDIRAVVRRLRGHGEMRGVLTTERSDAAALRAEVRDLPSATGEAPALEAGCRRAGQWPAATPDGPRWRLALYDFGVARSTLRAFAERGAELVLLPALTPAREALALGADGIVLSHGPGDPAPLAASVETVRELLASGTPLFGIGLGHLLLGLALGARGFRLGGGHHGANQPVFDRLARRVAITSQNHAFALVPESLPAGCEVVEVNLNDGSVEGFMVTGRPVFAIQYQPGVAFGPHPAGGLFGRFLAALPERGASGRA